MDRGKIKASPISTMTIQTNLAMSLSILQHCCTRSLPSDFRHFQPKSAEDSCPPCDRSASYRTTIQGCLRRTSTEFLRKSQVFCVMYRTLCMLTSLSLAGSSGSVSLTNLRTDKLGSLFKMVTTQDWDTLHPAQTDRK